MAPSHSGGARKREYAVLSAAFLFALTMFAQHRRSSPSHQQDNSVGSSSTTSSLPPQNNPASLSAMSSSTWGQTACPKCGCQNAASELRETVVELSAREAEVASLKSTIATLTDSLARQQAAPTPDAAVYKRNRFYDVAITKGTDKVLGSGNLAKADYRYPQAEHEECKVFGHFYDTMYDRWLPGPTEPAYQMVEIGFFNGKGFEAFQEYSPNAQIHSLEVSCLPPGNLPRGGRAERKRWTTWPSQWGNFAAKNVIWYPKLLEQERLHCGDASALSFLHETWEKMRARPDAAPLRVVIDDGSHEAYQMVATVFFWFPRLEPGGLLIVEDIQPQTAANLFRTEFLPQMMKDLHSCGADVNFPTLKNLIASVHCELHICLFQRNEKPSQPDLSAAESRQPKSALHPGTQ